MYPQKSFIQRVSMILWITNPTQKTLHLFFLLFDSQFFSLPLFLRLGSGLIGQFMDGFVWAPIISDLLGPSCTQKCTKK